MKKYSCFPKSIKRCQAILHKKNRSAVKYWARVSTYATNGKDTAIRTSIKLYAQQRAFGRKVWKRKQIGFWILLQKRLIEASFLSRRSTKIKAKERSRTLLYWDSSASFQPWSFSCRIYERISRSDRGDLVGSVDLYSYQDAVTVYTNMEKLCSAFGTYYCTID